MSHIQDVLRGLYFRKSRQESLFHALDRIEAAQRELGRGIDRIDSAQEAAGQTIDQIKERLLRFEVALSRIAGRSTPDSESLSSQNKRIMYSQFGEDMLVEHLFPTLANGRYLDVGCYHPYKFSNTAKLYARGWSGVNIDANPKTINLFKAERPSDINLNVIVGNGPIEEAAFYILDDDSPSNTLSVQFAEAQAQNMNKKLPDPIMVKKVTLSEVMGSHFEKGPPLYLNIDAEATDLEVLQSGDWQTQRPPLVSVEDGAFIFDDPLVSDLYRFMKSANYVMYSRCHATSFFVDDKFWKYVQHGGSLEQGL